VADLVSFLHRLGIEKIADLAEILSDEESINKTIEELGRGYEGVTIIWRSPVDVLTLALCYQQGVPMDALEETYKDSVTDVVRSLRGEPPRLREDPEGTA
jgi:hypothetical protein